MINQLAEEYSNQPVVFLDYHYDMAVPPAYLPPQTRWDVIQASVPPGTPLSLTWAVVDSGRRIHRGAETTDVALTEYRAMVNDALLQPPKAEINAVYWREDDSVNILATVTNNSTIMLSTANNASVHAIAKEPGVQYPTHTTLHPGLNSAMASISNLAPGETGSYFITLPDLQPTDWENLEFIVLVDYQTGLNLPYDQLQAAFAQPATSPSSIFAQPNSFYFMVSETEPFIPEFSSTILGDPGVTWKASVDKPWLTIDQASGGIGDSIVPTVDTTALTQGWQTATIKVVDDASIWQTGITVTIFKMREPAEALSRKYLPILSRP